MRPPDAAAAGEGRDPRTALWCIVLLAVVLRAWGLDHNLPFRDYIEEDEFIYTALKYGTGDLNPHWFFHPPLYSYILFSLYGVYFIAGKATGWFDTPADFVLQYLVDPGGFYMIARCLSVALAVPAILALYALANRLYSRRCALASCTFLAVMPLAVRYYHFGCTEPLVILFGILTALFSARFMETGRTRDSILAGLFAGLTMGSKYIGAVVVFLPIASHLASREEKRPRALVLSFPAVALGFLAACPQALLSTREYLANVRLLASQPLSVGEYAWVKGQNLYLAFAIGYMPQGMGLALAWVSLAGVAYLWVRHRRSDILVAVVPTVFYAVIGLSRLYYDRYMLVCYPFLAIAAAVLLDALSGLLPRARSAVLTMLCAAACVPALVRSVAEVRALMLPDASFVAAQWVTDNLPQGTRILVDGAPVPMSEKSMLREQALKELMPRSPYGYRSMSGLFFDLQRRASRGRKGFDAVRMLHPRGFYMVGDGKGYEEEWMTPEIMRSQLESLHEYDYVLISMRNASRYGDPEKLPERFRFMSEFYADLPSRAAVERVFGPGSCRCKGAPYVLYRVAGGGRLSGGSP